MSRSPHLLIVDDDREIRDLLGRFLKKHGYRVTTVQNGVEMNQVLEGYHFDLIVLDIMLPGDDGLTLCRKLRAKSKIPIIMLTAIGEDTDKIIGLEVGADDYLVKPFNPRELLARIKAVQRRFDDSGAARENQAANILEFSGWRLDKTRRELRSPDNVLLQLTAGEFDLLVAFVEHPQRVLNRDQLLDLTKGRSATGFDRSVDVQLSRLRRKLEDDPKNPKIIKTVRSGGYIFSCPVTKADQP